MKRTTLFGVFAVVLTWLFVSGCDEDSRKVNLAGNEIIYANSVTRAEAAMVGKYLRDAHWMEDNQGLELRLSKSHLDYQLQWNVGDDFFPFPDTVAFYQRLSDSLSKVLKGRTVEISLFDRNYYSDWRVYQDTMAYVPIGEGILYFEEPVSREEGERVSALLSGEPFFTDKPRLLMLRRYGSEYQVRIALEDEWQNEIFLDEMYDWANLVNRELYPDAEVFFHACDHLFNLMEVVTARPFDNVFEMGRLNLLFTNEVSSPDAARLRVYIENCLNSDACHYFERARRVTMEINNGKIQIGLEALGDLDNPELKSSYKELVTLISRDILIGKSVVLRVYDPETWEYTLFSS